MVILTFAGVCRAEWIEVYDDDDLTVYVDDDIQKTEAGYWVWQKLELKEPEIDNSTKKRYDEDISYILFSTDFRKYCLHQQTSFYKGKVLRDATFCRGEEKNYPHDWENIMPESIGADVRDEIKAILRGEYQEDYAAEKTVPGSSEKIIRNGGRQKINVQRGHYYIANVTANSLNLRNGAGSNYEVANKVGKGVRVVVSGDDLLEGGFGMVICEDGSKFGYASVDYLNPVEELSASAKGALEEGKQLTHNRTVCNLVVENTASAPITIQFASKTVQIPSGGTRKLNGITPGKYDFLATAKGFNPFHSVEVVKGGYEYNFVIYEKTTRVK